MQKETAMPSEYYVTDVLNEPLPPPKGVTVERDMMGGGVVLTYRRIRYAPLITVVVVSMMMTAPLLKNLTTHLTQPHFSFREIGFMELLALIFVSYVSLAMLFVSFGKQVLRLNYGQGTLFSGIWRLGRKWVFTYNHRSVIELKREPESKIADYTPKMEILVKTDDKEFAFGENFSFSAQTYILAVLKREAGQQP
jgi:hypothetical protein